MFDLERSCAGHLGVACLLGRPIGQVESRLIDLREALYARRSWQAERFIAAQRLGQMVGRVADKTVQIFGGAGYVADYGIERFYRDVRIFRLYEGTSQIQQIVIARNLLRGEG